MAQWRNGVSVAEMLPDYAALRGGRDRAVCDKLAIFLKPWMRRGLQFWADDYIQVGERWEREIDGSWARADAPHGTLRAIGFGATPVVVSVLTEAALLGAIGAVLGTAFAWLTFDGRNMWVCRAFKLRVPGALCAWARMGDRHVAPRRATSGVACRRALPNRWRLESNRGPALQRGEPRELPSRYTRQPCPRYFNLFTSC